jgi:hypothetical protein
VRENNSGTFALVDAEKSRSGPLKQDLLSINASSQFHQEDQFN